MLSKQTISRNIVSNTSSQIWYNTAIWTSEGDVWYAQGFHLSEIVKALEITESCTYNISKQINFACILYNTMCYTVF